MNDPNTTMSEYERDQQTRMQINEGNKAAVFDALATSNIDRVLVEFDGEGDSGQIDGVNAHAGDTSVEFPATTVSLHLAQSGCEELVIKEMPLREAVEELCYDYLEVTHDGWVNNDGAFGEFHFDVAARTIDLEFHGRFTDTCTSNHTF